MAVVLGSNNLSEKITATEGSNNNSGGSIRCCRNLLEVASFNLSVRCREVPPKIIEALLSTTGTTWKRGPDNLDPYGDIRRLYNGKMGG